MNLKNIYLLILILIFPLVIFADSAQDVKKMKMIADLEVIKNTLEVKYAPASWKKTFLGWDLEEQIHFAKESILSKDAITVKDYQSILRQFFTTMKDYHTGVEFYSTEIALLPFQVQSVNGKYFITSVMRWEGVEEDLKGMEDAHSLLAYLSLRQGDEILLFDGRPVDEVVKEIKSSYFGNFTTETDQRLAERALTLRMGAKGETIPEGKIALTIKEAATGSTTVYDLKWFYLPEKIQNAFKTVNDSTDSKEKRLSQHPFFHKKMSLPFYDQLCHAKRSIKEHLFKKSKKFKKGSYEEDDDDDEDNDLLGAKKSPFPPLGKIIWEAPHDEPFHAYVFETPNHAIVGYIRIPTFMGHAYQADAFESIIDVFNCYTDCLVIDQLNNPGGSYFYMNALASRLTDKPLLNAPHRTTLTQQDVMFALDTLEEIAETEEQEILGDLFDDQIHGYVVDNNFIKNLENHLRFIINEWNEKRYLTEPVHLYGMEYIHPNPSVNYTKPILVLVNSLDFSCADFFPALLQDNGRAVIFGAKTAGAGGYVLQLEYPSIFGVAGFSFTGSIAERANKDPIENLGVTPDISYELTERDLKENYSDYIKAVQKALETLISP